MRKSDVSELLTFIALFDKRKVGDPDVEAWCWAMLMRWMRGTRWSTGLRGIRVSG
jgi:hypothetical protein